MNYKSILSKSKYSFLLIILSLFIPSILIADWVPNWVPYFGEEEMSEEYKQKGRIVGLINNTKDFELRFPYLVPVGCMVCAGLQCHPSLGGEILKDESAEINFDYSSCKQSFKVEAKFSITGKTYEFEINTKPEKRPKLAFWIDCDEEEEECYYSPEGLFYKWQKRGDGWEIIFTQKKLK